MKKQYIKPKSRIIKLELESTILAVSGNPNSRKIEVEDEDEAEGQYGIL